MWRLVFNFSFLSMRKHYVQGDNVWLPVGQVFSPILEASLDSAKWAAWWSALYTDNISGFCESWIKRDEVKDIS